VNRTKQVVEAGLFAAIMVLLMVGSFYLPIIGMLIFFVIPLPVIILTIRNTLPNVIVATVVATMIASAMVTIVYGVGIGVLALTVGLPLGIAFKNKFFATKSIALGGFGALIGFFLVIVVMQSLMGLSIYDQLDEMFEMSSEMQQQMTSVLGTLNNTSVDDSIAQTALLWDNMKYMMKLIFPSAMILFSIVYSLGNYLFARPILKRLNISVVPMGSFKDFSYPKHMAYGSGLILILAYIVGIAGLADPELVFTNFLYLFLMVFSVQGLALIYFFLLRYMPRGIAIVLLVIFGMSSVLQYISLIGFLDVIIGIRKRLTKKR